MSIARVGIVRMTASATLLLAVVGACAHPPARASDVTTTGASRPRPSSLPPPSRTVDSTGFVDPGGRTSDHRDRTELSGMRPTESGMQVPTGTPGSGLPLPIEPRAPRVARERPTGADQIQIGPPPNAGTVTEAVADAVLLAYCQREQRCGREPDVSLERCRQGVGSRYREELGRAGCPYSFDADAVVSCLSNIHALPCGVGVEDLAKVSRCTSSAMCLPR